MAIEEREPLSPEAALLAALGELRVTDASPVIEPGMPMFAAYEGPEITPLFGHEEAGAAANRISLTVERLAPDALLLRPYKKFDLSGEGAGPGELLGAEALRSAASRGGFALEPGDVAIVEMGWDRYWPGGPAGAAPGFWGRNEPGLTDDACRYLAEAGISAVASDTAGCDVPCVDGDIGIGSGHGSWFLPRGILIVEGLRGLAEVAPTGLFLALPLKIRGGTGSPLRVLLLERAEVGGV